MKLKKTSPEEEEEESRKKMKEGTRVASNERRLINRGVGTGEAMKPGLHRKSELLLHRNFKHLGYMKGENFRASPEKSSFRRPCRCWMLDNNKVVLTYPFNVKITLDHGCQTSNDISEFRCLQCSLMYIILY